MRPMILSAALTALTLTGCGSDVAAPASTTAGSLADTYRIDEFSVPFVITTQGDWTRQHSSQELFDLARGSNAATEFMVTSGLVAGSTPQEALDTWCANGTVDFGEPSTTTLFGKPAIQEDGTVNSVCTWAALDILGNDSLLLIFPGHTVRLVAADVGGKIVVVVADAPSADWSTFSIEVDALIASMTLAV